MKLKLTLWYGILLLGGMPELYSTESTTLMVTKTDGTRDSWDAQKLNEEIEGLKSDPNQFKKEQAIQAFSKLIFSDLATVEAVVTEKRASTPKPSTPGKTLTSDTSATSDTKADETSEPAIDMTDVEEKLSEEDQAEIKNIQNEIQAKDTKLKPENRPTQNDSIKLPREIAELKNKILALQYQQLIKTIKEQILTAVDDGSLDTDNLKKQIQRYTYKDLTDGTTKQMTLTNEKWVKSLGQIIYDQIETELETRQKAAAQKAAREAAERAAEQARQRAANLLPEDKTKIEAYLKAAPLSSTKHADIKKRNDACPDTQLQEIAKQKLETLQATYQAQLDQTLQTSWQETHETYAQKKEAVETALKKTLEQIQQDAISKEYKYLDTSTLAATKTAQDIIISRMITAQEEQYKKGLLKHLTTLWNNSDLNSKETKVEAMENYLQEQHAEQYGYTSNDLIAQIEDSWKDNIIARTKDLFQTEKNRKKLAKELTVNYAVEQYGYTPEFFLDAADVPKEGPKTTSPATGGAAGGLNIDILKATLKAAGMNDAQIDNIIATAQGSTTTATTALTDEQLKEEAEKLWDADEGRTPKIKGMNIKPILQAKYPDSEEQIDKVVNKMVEEKTAAAPAKPNLFDGAGAKLRKSTPATTS